MQPASPTPIFGASATFGGTGFGGFSGVAAKAESGEAAEGGEGGDDEVCADAALMQACGGVQMACAHMRAFRHPCVGPVGVSLSSVPKQHVAAQRPASTCRS